MTLKCPYCSGEMATGLLRAEESTGVCFEPIPGFSDTFYLSGPHVFRRSIQCQSFCCRQCAAIVFCYKTEM